MLWIHSQLTSAIRDYCILFRKKIPNARRHDYLFVTHKKGPYQGQPLSKSGFRRVIQDIASTLPQLGVLHGHLFRHTWNDRFSRHMDSMDNPPSERIQETIRSYLQGWMPDSGTSATYNKRFVEQKAMQAGLAMQQSIINSPSTLK
jgi:integrase